MYQQVEIRLKSCRVNEKSRTKWKSIDFFKHNPNHRILYKDNCQRTSDLRSVKHYNKVKHRTKLLLFSCPAIIKQSRMFVCCFISYFQVVPFKTQVVSTLGVLSLYALETMMDFSFQHLPKPNNKNKAKQNRRRRRIYFQIRSNKIGFSLGVWERCIWTELRLSETDLNYEDLIHVYRVSVKCN